MNFLKKINLNPLKLALSKFNIGLERALKNPDDEELRDACIQRFEYSYELCWKLLKRQLESEIGNSQEVDSYSKKQLFRVAGERGILHDVEKWFVYLELRNLTSHTYNEEVADETFKALPDFLISSRKLLGSLEERNA